MISHTLPYNGRYASPHRRTLPRRTLWFLWQTARLPVLAMLLVLEPFMSLLLTTVGLLGIVTAVILRFSSDLPHFPFWEMIALSISSILVLMAYHILIGLLSR